MHSHSITRLTLAPGVQVRKHGVQHCPMLLFSAGAAHLNHHAAAIFELCDGSRTRDQLIIDAVLHSSGALQTCHVVAFLDAARSRGWVVENR